MDIEKLIERLQNAAGGPEGIKMCHDAATALSTLQAENEKLRTELERMKKIMRDNGIMTIPPKYPGWPTEWCGAPMTDEAVDIVMRRLEALGYDKDD